MKKCPNCGCDMPQESNFCLNCFTNLESNEKNTSKVHKPSRRTKKVAAVLCIVLALTCTIISSAMNRASKVKNVVPQAGAVQVNGKEGESTEKEKGGFFDFFTKKDKDETESKNNSIFDIFKKPESTNTSTASESTQTVHTSPSYPTSDNNNSAGSTGNVNSTTSLNNSNDIQTTTSKPAEPEFDRFEYVDSKEGKNLIEITKYTGNATHVRVPASIDSKYVVKIKKYAFKDNSKIKEVTFESDKNQRLLWIDDSAFYNLSSLVTVNLPETDIGIGNEICRKCYSLKTLNITNNQYRFYNGGLYRWNGKDWALRFYAPGYTAQVLTVPSWSKGIEHTCNIQENAYLKVINLHKGVTYFPSLFFHDRSNLEAVNVEPGNSTAYTYDGTLVMKYTNGKCYIDLYPRKKKDKTFKIPENVELRINGDFKNEYLETLWIPKTAKINQPSFIFYSMRFKNLKTIHVQKGSQYLEEAKDTFTGNVIEY